MRSSEEMPISWGKGGGGDFVGARSDPRRLYSGDPRLAVVSALARASAPQPYQSVGLLALTFAYAAVAVSPVVPLGQFAAPTCQTEACFTARNPSRRSCYCAGVNEHD